MSAVVLQARRTSANGTAAMVGIIGGVVGVAVGIVEITIGPSIRPWIGNKHDTTRLGLATIALSSIAIVAALALVHSRRVSPPRRFALGLALLVPGLICFTTVGRLWYPSGALIVTSGAITMAGVRGHWGAVLATVGRNWTVILTAVLGAIYVALGIAAQGATGVLGVVGGFVTIALLIARRSAPMPIALSVLVLAVAPFAVATWWSLVTPSLAVLIVVIGAFALAPTSFDSG